MEIVIPTYKRLDNQVTLKQLPEQWQKRTTLVVRGEEYQKASDLYGSKVKRIMNIRDLQGISAARKAIAQEFSGKRHHVIDDDVVMKRKIMDGKGYYEHKSVTTSDDFDWAFDMSNKFMDVGFIQTSFLVGSTPIHPADYTLRVCYRTTTNMAFSDKMDFSKIDFAVGSPIDGGACEDFYITLQCLTQGMPNVVMEEFRSFDVPHLPGGCSTFRTVEKHNEALKCLQSKFPKFVKLKSRVNTSGHWKGMEQLKSFVLWTQAFKSSGDDNRRWHKIAAEVNGGKF